MSKLKIGITVGDINGIGLEVILKTLANKQITDFCTPVIYGSSKVVSYHKNIINNLELQFTGVRSVDQVEEDKVNVVNCWQENVNITLGKLADTGGIYAFKSLEQAVADLKSGSIDALVTAPINKKAMAMAGFPFPGHTEYLTEQLGNKESLMLLVSDNFRVGLVTNHEPISNVAAKITKERILTKIKILNETLKIDFGIEKPTIAVLGLNPHAGDEGVIGKEEQNIIIPTIEQAKEQGIMAFGPMAADGFFGSGQYNKFDGILAMYHDQGLVPFKAMSFGSGVNYTAGLVGVRTSPDHGTAYDIAGQNMADPSSFRAALFLAIDIARNRKAYTEDHSNPMRSRAKLLDLGEDEVITE